MINHALHKKFYNWAKSSDINATFLLVHTQVSVEKVMKMRKQRVAQYC